MFGKSKKRKAREDQELRQESMRMAIAYVGLLLRANPMTCFVLDEVAEGMYSYVKSGRGSTEEEQELKSED